jgi:hypothetical protein
MGRRLYIVVVVALIAGLASMVPAQAAGTLATASIIGRWQQSHTCDQLVSALDALGLGSLAPGVVGDYFPNLTPQQLAAKPDICSGATPQLHSHFFTASGAFGSLDQFQNQVDDGTYVTVDSNTFKINGATFDYSTRSGHLTLTPVITDQQRRDALRHPWDFTTAGWMVAVSYPGTTWNQVACQGWC